MRGGIAIALLATGLGACARPDAFASAVPPPAGEPRCAAGPDGAPVCLEGVTDCEPGALACEPSLADPVGELRALAPEGRPLSFRAGVMSTVSRGNHFQSVQRLPGAEARFVVTRETALREETDIGLVESAGGGGPARIARAFDTGTAWTHAGGTQRVGRVLAVPLERGARGSAVHLYDFSRPAAPRLIAAVPHTGPDGEPVGEAGAAALAPLAGGRYLLVVATRHARRLDFYLSAGPDLAGAWRHLDRWSAGELATAIDDRSFGAYQGIHLVTGGDGALYLIGSHRLPLAGDWLDLHRLSLGAGRRTEIVLTKLARKRLDCRVGGAPGCTLDAGAGLSVDDQGRLRVHAIGYAAARATFAPRRALAPVHLVEFVSRGASGAPAARDRAAALPPGMSPRR